MIDSGDDRLRRKRLNPDGEPRGTDLVKSVQYKSAKSTDYAALPLAA